jgi:hypothetical protein
VKGEQSYKPDRHAAGESVEVYDSRLIECRNHTWIPGEVDSPGTEQMPYVRVRIGPEKMVTTYHMNVKTPGAVDPIQDSYGRKRGTR